jgi:hypothetical protein
MVDIRISGQGSKGRVPPAPPAGGVATPPDPLARVGCVRRPASTLLIASRAGERGAA